MGNRFTKCVLFIALLLSGMMMSCQKDADVKDSDTSGKADSAIFTSPNNYLAVKGTLTITIQDSTYSFDAAHDSIAFVNVHSGNSQYFGITAINKAHNMSFGISSAGYALGSISTAVAGSQFILKPDSKPGVQFALTDDAAVKDFGKLSLDTYKKDSILAKGTFYTYLAAGDVLKSAPVKVKGTFNLFVRR